MKNWIVLAAFASTLIACGESEELDHDPGSCSKVVIKNVTYIAHGNKILL